MTLPFSNIPEGKKIYFASDFHLGAPNKEASMKREKKIIDWLASVSTDAYAIFLVGDIFDFWYEYKHVVPKGYIRFLGKIAALKDQGIHIYFFTGNHDVWMFRYFTEELGIPVFRDPISIEINNKKLMIGHGDGVGPGDRMYKHLLRPLFTSKFCQSLFSMIHPTIAFTFANAWSKKSRISNSSADEIFYGENERLLQFCKENEKKEHYDYYIFGHRHLPLHLKVSNNSSYVNLGEWFKSYSYAVFDGEKVDLLFLD